MTASVGLYREEADQQVSAPAPAAMGHGHLWTLPDGTGLHAPAGQLARDADGLVCCHLCGRWFRALGSHVRVHGYTARAYREELGLCSTLPLTAPELSTSISRRQAVAYQRCEVMRERLATGQQSARSGALTQQARVTLSSGEDPPQRRDIRRGALERGRRTRADRRRHELATRLAELGAGSLAEYLRHAYGGGASLETLARETGLGRSRLRQAMVDAGVVPRPTGVNAAGRRSRADTADSIAAARLGNPDLHQWLTDQHAAGWSVARLARAVGHSNHWVRRRLAASVAQSPTTMSG